MRSPGDSARRSSAAWDGATKGENGFQRGDGFVSVAANVVDVGTIVRFAKVALVFEAARTVSSPNLSLRAAAAHCSTSRSSANPRAADSGRVVVVGAAGPIWKIAAAPGLAGPSALGLAGAGDMTRTVAS